MENSIYQRLIILSFTKNALTQYLDISRGLAQEYINISGIVNELIKDEVCKKLYLASDEELVKFVLSLYYKNLTKI